MADEENIMELIDFRIMKKTSNGKIQEQIFGINVYKVKEVIFRPDKINSVPNKSEFLEGMINLRGHVIPIINLQKRLGYNADDIPCDYLVITEFNDLVCGFMVHQIRKIRQIAWSDITAPPEEIKGEYGDLVTAITLLDDKEIMLILDFEKILGDLDEDYVNITEGIDAVQVTDKSKTILCVDDSRVARNLARQVLETGGYNIIEAVNGIDALQIIKKLSDESILDNTSLASKIGLILCDVEMPLMDGFTFTKTVKSDPAYGRIPVILHSSLSKSIITGRGASAGADDFLTKFDAGNLLEAVRKFEGAVAK